MRLVILAALLACAAPANALVKCPNTGLRQVPVVLMTSSGPHMYRLDVAGSAEQQECGLMYRKQMKRDAGMIFPFPVPRRATFWMENTVLPLDLIFVGPDKRVVSIGSGKPFSRDMIDSGGVAASVIELNAGEAKRIGLKPGDEVQL